MASKIKLLARKSHFNNDLKQQSPGASLINFFYKHLLEPEFLSPGYVGKVQISQ